MQQREMSSWASAGARSQSASRSQFIMLTYLHLFGAVMAFVAVEVALFASGLALPIAQAMMGGSWLLVLGGFILVSWLATRVAHSTESLPLQYLALGGFVVAEAIVFVPLLVMATISAPGAISSAGWVTVMAFAGLTAVVFTTRKDFSFMGSILRWGGVVALVTIVAGVIFGFHLGTFFSVAMVALAGGSILYDTSNVLRHYPHDRYVGASLQLFASVAMMFWYILRIFSSRD